jgi:ATP-dependent RNA helicase DeaD
MEKFRKLGIIEPILKSIQEEKFETPSEIQEKSIPLILDGKDVIAGASTGSGKTLVFASVIIKNAERGAGTQALILTPTRELALQVTGALNMFSKHKHLEIIAVYGGVGINPQIYGLRTADVVVGTPGRILDHIDRRTIDLSRVKILVLDEADRMLDMGFKDDVEKIIRRCPEKRQTLLFSATISRDIARLAGKYMKNPVEVSAEAYVDPAKLTHIYYDVEDSQKFSLLVHLLKHEKAGLVMVFCNTQRNTDFVANNLKAEGIDVLAIHGGYSQEKRSRTMEKFHSQRVSVLVCTDVAARGLDIKAVSHIYNYDAPKSSDEYIHRVGRTARAGKEGKAVSIISGRDYDNFRRVLGNRDLNIVKGEIPEMERIWIKFRDSRTRGFGGSGGRSGGGFRGRGGGSGGSHRGGGYGESQQRSFGSRYGSQGREHRSRENAGRPGERGHFSRGLSGRNDSKFRRRY